MDDNRGQPHNPPNPTSPGRRFVYRAVENESGQSHPLRRSTDTPVPFQGIPGELSPRALLLKFRVFLKVN